MTAPVQLVEPAELEAIARIAADKHGEFVVDVGAQILKAGACAEFDSSQSKGARTLVTHFDQPVLFTLTGPEAKHAVAVRRLKAGQRVDICDGHGRRLCARVSAATRDSLEVAGFALLEEASTLPALILVQALGKGGRDEQAIEAATECGADQVMPWMAARCVSRWEGPKVAKGQARWVSVVREAAKQARRSWVPEILALADSKELAAQIAAARENGEIVFILHESAQQTLVEACAKYLPSEGQKYLDEKSALQLKEFTPDSSSENSSVPDLAPEIAPKSGDAGLNQWQRFAFAPRIWFIVGPEGGISDEELELFTAAGATAVVCGSHVMRTSTAGPVAISYLAARLGRWEQAKPSDQDPLF